MGIMNLSCVQQYCKLLLWQYKPCRYPSRIPAGINPLSLGWRAQSFTADCTGRCFSKNSRSWGKKDQCPVQFCNDSNCHSHSLTATCCLLPVSKSDKAGNTPTVKLYMALNRHLGIIYSRLQRNLFDLLAVVVLDSALGQLLAYCLTVSCCYCREIGPSYKTQQVRKEVWKSPQ